MKNISLSTFIKAITNVVEELEKQREYFNDLDTPIGDSDHGDSICSTFNIVKNVIDDFDSSNGNIESLFKSTGKAIVFSGGAAMGPLYGTAFLDAGQAVSGKKEVNYQEFVALWVAFKAGIERRGKVKTGEKTMFDTIDSAVNELITASETGCSLEEAVPRVIKASERGMNSTKDMLSLRGRSSRLGDRSLGYIDPGSASMNCLIKAFFGVIAEDLVS